MKSSRCGSQVGQEVKEGDIILEVETDKAAVEIPSPFSGKVLEIRVTPGEMVKVGQVLLVFDGAGEKDSAADEAPDSARKTPDAAAPAPSARPPAELPADEPAPAARAKARCRPRPPRAAWPVSSRWIWHVSRPADRRGW